jgi:hypothetical protein
MAERSNDHFIRALAQRCMARHLQVSYPDQRLLTRLIDDPPKPDRGTKPSDVQVPDLTKRIRVVALVGAGASAELFGTTPQLVEKLVRRDLQDTTFRAECERLSYLLGRPSDSLEVTAAAAAQSPTAVRDIRREIAEEFNLRHPALLQYELLAHLLKHRFIDAIVSYNFDELLDQSLLDEVGRDEFITLVSDRDARLVPTWNPDDDAYVPLYIKPHGTASDPESLRFRLEDYYYLPARLWEGMSELVGQDLTVFINIGSSVAASDHRQLLVQPVSTEIFNISSTDLGDAEKEVIDKLRVASGRPLPVEHFPLRTARSRLGAPKPVVKAPTGKKRSIAAHLVDLVNTISEVGAEVPRLNPVCRSVARHELVTGPWFRWRNWRSVTEQNDYRRDRALVEIALSAIKGKGLCSIAALDQDRCAVYYDLMRGSQSGIRWRELCALGGLYPASLSNETFLLDPRFVNDPDIEWEIVPTPQGDEASVKNPAPMLRLTRQASDFHYEAYAAEILRHLQPSTVAEEDRSRWTKEIGTLLAQVREGTEVEVFGRSDRICSKVFRSPVVLRTLSALEGNTEALVQQALTSRGHTVRLLIAASSGAFLLNNVERWIERAKQHGVKAIELWVLVSFAQDQSGLQDRIEQACEEHGYHSQFPPDPPDDLGGDLQNGGTDGPQCTVYQRTISWWRHSRHMTVAQLDGRNLGAVYFARRLRVLGITPVLLGADDAVEVLKHFHRHWLIGKEQDEDGEITDL